MNTLKVYKDIHSFSTEVEPHLLLNECENSNVLTMLKQAVKENTLEFGAAVMNSQNELVFAMILHPNTNLFGSFVKDVESIDLVLIELIAQEKHTQIKYIHAFEPALSHIHQFLATHTSLSIQLIDRVWAYDIRQVVWSEKPLALKNDPLTTFRVATEQDIPLIYTWSIGFLDYFNQNNYTVRPPVASFEIEEQIKQGTIYLLEYNQEPVCMAWKRRPTKNGVAISIVYTPEEKRGKSYANCCVSMFTELLLKDFTYVTLFVHGDRDINYNLYTKIGYQYIGKAARLYIQ